MPNEDLPPKTNSLNHGGRDFEPTLDDIIRVAIASFDQLTLEGMPPETAIEKVCNDLGVYCPPVSKASELGDGGGYEEGYEEEENAVLSALWRRAVQTGPTPPPNPRTLELDPHISAGETTPPQINKDNNLNKNRQIKNNPKNKTTGIDPYDGLGI